MKAGLGSAVGRHEHPITPARSSGVAKADALQPRTVDRSADARIPPPRCSRTRAPSTEGTSEVPWLGVQLVAPARCQETGLLPVTVRTTRSFPSEMPGTPSRSPPEEPAACLESAHGPRQDV